MKTKDIEVNGVKIRIHKMSPFEQMDLVNTFIPTLSGVIRAVFGSNVVASNAGAVADAMDAFVSKIDAEKRKDVLFNHLLSPEIVSVVVDGVEMPLISDAKTAKTVMSDNLNDITYLLQIGVEVVRFNFERFFEFGKSTLARK